MHGPSAANVPLRTRRRAAGIDRGWFTSPREKFTASDVSMRRYTSWYACGVTTVEDGTMVTRPSSYFIHLELGSALSRTSVV